MEGIEVSWVSARQVQGRKEDTNAKNWVDIMKSGRFGKDSDGHAMEHVVGKDEV